MDVPVTPGSAAPKPLILTREPARSQGANSGGDQDRRAFLGTWRGLFHGKTFILLSLKVTDGALSGAVTVGGFRINESGQVAQVNEEPNTHDAVPVTDAKLDGPLLTFKGKSRNWQGTVVQFQMKLTGEGAAELKCLIPDTPPGAPVAGWWKIVRQSDDHPAAVRRPAGGVVGGVTGGIAEGVAGGVVGGRVPGGVTGGVAGGVTGKVVGGIAGGVPGGIVGGI